MCRYVSPEPTDGCKGTLSACAIRDLAPYISNYINRRRETIKVEPPNEIAVPGLRTYTHIQVTGQIISRTIMPPSGDDPKSPAGRNVRPRTSATCVFLIIA